MAWPRFFPPFDQSSKISVLPDPVGAWTTTSLPDRSPATASCCQRSGTVTWLRRDRLPICSAIVPTAERYLSVALLALHLCEPVSSPSDYRSAGSLSASVCRCPCAVAPI